MKSSLSVKLALSLGITVSSLCPAFASNDHSATIAFTFSMPPYLSSDNSSGIEHDVIHSALEEVGYDSVKIVNVHYLRAIELIKQGEIDAVVSNQSNSVYTKHIPSIVTSNKTIDYVDCAITLKKRGISLDNIQDYYDKSIWAFKSASEVFGTDFKDMTLENNNYSENFDQLKQIDMLAMQRIDVAISDRNIFSSKLQSNEKYKNLQFNFHSIAPPTPRVIRSSNKRLIDNFNKGLDAIKKSGKYKIILEHYRSNYTDACNK